MGIIKTTADLIYTFRFLKLLVTKFEDTDAYKAGIIDDKGNRIKTYDKYSPKGREDYRNYYTPFHRVVYNIKKLMAKVPGGSSRIATYAAALYLIKEQYGVSEKNIEKAIREAGADPTDFMLEQNTWFVLSDNRLSPGSYKLKNEKILNLTFEEIGKPRDYIRVGENAYPVGTLFGLNIYEAVHTKTNQKVYVTIAELTT